jgi:hypothetical protein
MKPVIGMEGWGLKNQKKKKMLENSGQKTPIRKALNQNTILD